MAIPKIKATYSLDVETTRLLEGMAREWDVSKSEALRRAIHIAAAEAGDDVDSPLRAFDEFVEALELTPEDARRWAREVRKERRAWEPARPEDDDPS